jgi:hypothetical protein
MSTRHPAPLPRATAAEDAGDAPHRRLSLLCAIAAALCWAGALLLLFVGRVDTTTEPLASPRLLFYGLVVGAALLTFGPLEALLRIPGLTVEGVAGSALLLYTLAFVPAPTGWLLALPETPVYALLMAGVFLTAAAAATAPLFLLGRRVFRQRARQYDLRRARRQAHEVGALAALSVGMAGLRVLTPLSMVLLALILVVIELLFLSFVEAGN